MLFDNVHVGMIVCDTSMDHQKVIAKNIGEVTVQLEDGKWYEPEDLDVDNHLYKHLVSK
jgi:hypothetical protein